MADVLGTDELLVNREGVTYTQEQQTLMANLEKDDLLLVNRLGQTYTMTGEDLANSIIDPLELVVTLAPTDAYTDVEVTAIPFVTGGKLPDGGFVFSYQWYTADDNLGTNKVEIAGETTANFTPGSIIIGSFFGCEISTTDALGVEASGESFIGPVSAVTGPPVIFDVTVSEIEDGINRYTDKEFPYVTTMTLEGEPAPDFELKAKVSGTTFDFTVKSDTITDVEGGGVSTCETDTIESVIAQTPSSTYFAKVDNTSSNFDGSYAWTTADGAATEFDVGVYVSGIGSSSVNTLHFYSPGSGHIVYLNYSGGTVYQVYVSETGNPGTYIKLGNFTQDELAANKAVSPYEYSYITNGSINAAGGYWGVEGTVSTTTLTFPSSNGFDCFEPGDVVQSDFGKNDWTSMVAGSPYSSSYISDYAFDGNPTTSAMPSSTFTLITTEFPKVDTVQIRGALFGTGYIKVNNVDYTSSFSSVQDLQTIPVTELTSIEWGVLSGNAQTNNVQISEIVVDGVTLLQGQGLSAKIVSISEEGDTNHPSITVDGGTWTTSDKLVKETSYDTKLTVASDKDLADMSGSVFGCSDAYGDGPFTQTPYKLTTTDIENVNDTDPANVVLTFPGDVSTNPDLRYFRKDDVVGSDGVVYEYTGDKAPTVTGDPFATPNNNGGQNSVIVNTPGVETSITYTFPSPVDINSVANQIGGGSYLANASFTLTWISSDGTEIVSGQANTNIGYGFQSFPVGAPSLVKGFKITGVGGSAFTGFYLNGVGVNVGNLGSPVKVINTGILDGTNSNTMVVDGGSWNDGDKVEYQTNGGQGDIVSVNTDDNTITLSDTGNRDNRWIAINSGEGSGVSKDFSVVPVNGTVVEQDFAWCKLQIIDDKAQVTGIQGTEPGFLPVTSKDYSIKFPAVFPTGNTPDEDIPRGTCIAAIVAAENNAGRSEKESNCFMPADVVGEGVAGPIIDSNSSTLVVGSSANLDTFSSGDNLVMCGFTGDLAEYTMRTTDIESVSEQIGLSIDASQMWSNPANFLNTPPTPTYPLSNAFDNSTLILYGNSLQTELPYPGSIVFIPPVPMSGDIYLVGGSDATYPEPAVLVNDETEALERITNVTDIGAYDWKIYRFVHSGPVNKITIVAKSQYDGTTGVKEVLIASLGVGYRWLIDSNQPNQEHTEVTPSTFEGIGRNDLQLTFPGLPSTNPDLKFFRQGDAIVDYQVWSSYGNGQTNGAYPQTLMFDGRVTDYNECCVPGSSAFVWEYPPGIPFETIEIAGIGKDQEVYINDQLVQNTNEFNIWQTNAKCVTITPQFTGNIGSKLYKIQLPAWQTGAAIAGIKLDGNWLIDDTRTPVKVVSTGWPESNTMVVDGGNWAVNDGTVNSDEIWSVNSSWTGSAPAADQAADKGFNGSTSYTDGYFYAVQGGTQTVLFNNLEFTTLELWTWNHAAANGELTVNGVSLTQAINDDPNTEEFFDGGFKFDATSLVTSPLTNITAAKLSSPTSGGFTAVFVDGKMLVDTDQAGMSFAEFGPVAGRANFVSTNGTDEVILLNSNDRWIDSSNRLGENFYFRDSITALDASNPKHVALQQEIAEAFAAFPEKVNERRTAIASSFYRLMGGEELTTAEFELLEETVTNAVNATEPFALDGYYPLYYTAAKADDASSLDSHHTHTINGIDYYMPDGGTLYHGNYITPD